MTSGSSLHRAEWNWIQAFILFVTPPTVAAVVVYLTYPNGSRIRALLLGFVFEFLAIIAVAAISLQMTQFIGRL
jgi:hypothetical protein